MDTEKRYCYDQPCSRCGNLGLPDSQTIWRCRKCDLWFCKKHRHKCVGCGQAFCYSCLDKRKAAGCEACMEKYF